MMRNLRRVVALATASGFFVGLLVARAPLPVAAATVSAPVVSTSESPSWALDAPDPDVVRDGDSYYAFTTGTTWGNHIGVLKSPSPVSGWNTVNGKSYGSTALPAPPGWQTTNTQTSPGVVSLGGRWVMYYDATVRATGKYCLSVATSSSPAQPFSDTTSGPWHCDDAFGGAIDPSPFVDTDGRAWLYWKTNDGSDPQPARIWAAPLSADGLAFAAAPAVVFTQDTVATPWETTVEDPDMIKVGDTYVLIFSANRWNSASYVQSDATCASPVGPCTQSTQPFLASYGSVAGPGGGTAFEAADGSWYFAYQGWTQGCTDYACGGARRLFVAPVQFGVLPPCTSSAAAAYVIAAADGSTAAFSSDGGACGRGLGVAPNNPIVGIASTPSTSGYWLVATDGGIFSFGDAVFCGSTGAIQLNQPIVGMAPTPSGHGYWLVARDGGVFAFGDAAFFGSTGAIQLNQPIVGMAPTPSGHGYWLVARDGGVFAFGDAAFFGSTGAIRLNQPIVGAATNAAGSGYWLVASDGGVFAFGRAEYRGSLGAVKLNQPIVALAPSRSGAGYRMVARDGGVFVFGDAVFAGSLGAARGSSAAVVGIT